MCEIAVLETHKNDRSQSLISLCHTNKATNGKTGTIQLLLWAAQAIWKSNQHNTLKIFRAQQLISIIIMFKKWVTISNFIRPKHQKVKNKKVKKGKKA